MTIYDKVRKAITEYQLVQDGELILAAVSGGPDSLAMLEILYELKDEFNYQLHVVHLNHKLRKEAKDEAEFVRQFAKSHEIPATILEYDIPALLKEEGGSVQDKAREVRYRLFNRVAEKVGATKIALGHHADDLAETVLMRFLRGAGLEGLVGFTARSRGNLIRPLIYVTREEIEAFCDEKGLTPCYDPSNAKPVYLRNRIRLKLIPMLEEEYNPNLRQQLVQMAHLLEEENLILEEYVSRIFENVLIKEEPEVLSFDLNVMSKKKPAILRRILRLGMEKLKGDKKDFYYQHYIKMQELILQGSPGKMVYLPDGYILYKGYKMLRLGKKEEILNQSLRQYTLTIPGETYLEESDLLIKAEVKEGQVLVKKDQAALDADLLGTALLIRSRKPGDWFYPLGLKGKKKLKDFLIDEKVDRFERNLIPIVTTLDGQIVWVAGYRVDDRFKVTPKTQKTCILTILKGGIKR